MVELVRADGVGAVRGKMAAAGALAEAGGRLREVTDFGANPGGLRMLLYVPPAGAGPGAPLVVVLHGCLQSAADYDHGAGWSALGAQAGFAVLAPEQRSANNRNGCFNWFKPADATREKGEAASIRQMIAYALAEHALDPVRIFITGLSAGGAMASAMLAAYPEIFAGGAIVAGLPYGAARNVPEALASMRQAPSRPRRIWGDLVRGASAHNGPWPKISVWHGDADEVVDARNADAIVEQWIDLHGLDHFLPAQEEVNGHARRLWRDGTGRPLLESYRIAGMAHGTPVHAAGGDAPAPFVCEAGISSSQRIAEFWGLSGTAAKAAPAASKLRLLRAARKKSAVVARAVKVVEAVAPIELAAVIEAVPVEIALLPQVEAEPVPDMPLTAERATMPESHVPTTPPETGFKHWIAKALRAIGILKNPP